jgi:hypothetical protein
MDDGENWQSLRLNMPATSIRDLVVHESDLVIGTHGRSIWILDDVSTLRDMSNVIKADQAHLIAPALATRVRFNMFGDTPFPPEEPAGQNPPDGAIIDYVLKKPSKDVKLEILDQQGNVVRKFLHTDKPETLDSTQVQHPMYWIREASQLSTTPGHHRFVWDLRYAVPQGSGRGLSIAAIYKSTSIGPVGPFVHPGKYTVRLTVDGKVSEQSIQVRLDPRTSISAEGVKQQTDLSMLCYNTYNMLQSRRDQIDVKLNNPKKKWKTGEKEKWQALRGSGEPDGGDIIYSSIREASLEKETIVSLQDKLLYMLLVFQSADEKPTEQAVEAVKKLTNRFAEMTVILNTMK